MRCRPKSPFWSKPACRGRRSAAAARRARDQGVGAEEVLIAEGLIDEDFYYRALARPGSIARSIERAAALAAGFDYRAALRASVARADPAPRGFRLAARRRAAKSADRGPAELSGRREPAIAICAPKFFSALARATGRRALVRRRQLRACRAPTRASAPMRRNCAGADSRADPERHHCWSGCCRLSTRLLDFASLLSVRSVPRRHLCALCAIAASLPRGRRRGRRAWRDRDLPDLHDRRADVSRGEHGGAIRSRALRGARLSAPPSSTSNSWSKRTIPRRRRRCAQPASRLTWKSSSPRAGAPRTKPRALNVALPLARGKLLAILTRRTGPSPDSCARRRRLRRGRAARRLPSGAARHRQWP